MAKKQKNLIHGSIAVRRSSTHGYGVFATKDIRKGTVIEECYFIVSRGGDKILNDYYFDAKGKYALFTGYGSIYNHADEPNADYFLNMKTRIAKIITETTIRKGEEITVSYGDKWFRDRGKTPKKIRKKNA